MTESLPISTAAVLGSGVMGAAIAALLANAGCTVYLLDIVPQGATDRNALALGGIQKQIDAKPASGFTHKRNVKRVIAGNLEDDVGVLAQCDWIIEAVLEDIAVKQKVYAQVDAHRKQGSVVSSNTSTIPLHVLIDGMPEQFQRDFMITHFFNPPRFLPLLEVTGGAHCDPTHLARIEQFADVHLGKGVVHCKDTPGFLANRIGIFWMLVGLYEALALGIRVEDADAVMGKPIGIPSTALFGLFDLIGIDLMPRIATAMLQTLPSEDRFRTLYHEPELIRAMISDGYTGRKGKGGFYCMSNEGGKKVKMVKNLITGAYAVEGKSTLESVSNAKAGLHALVNHPDIGGQFAKRVLVQTLHYAASLVPEISDDIRSIDEAMRLGFAWKYGPFELIDKLSTSQQSGRAWLRDACREMGLSVPALLEGTDGAFYQITPLGRTMRTSLGGYDPIPMHPHKWTLADKTRCTKPILSNAGGNVWDLGDGVACLELTTKMNTIDDTAQEIMERALERSVKDFRALVIGSDAEKFSLGANLGFVMFLANMASWDLIAGVIRRGHKINMALKYAPIPVVAAVGGMALGGGCELMLHCDAVQAHMETYPGLVEIGVGLVPGWGGCKELLWRHMQTAEDAAVAIAQGAKPEMIMPSGVMPALSKTYEYIVTGKVGGSAEDARDMLLLNKASRISMNRTRLLPDAKALALSLAEDYTPPQPRTFHLAGESGKIALLMGLESFALTGKASPHDVVVGTHLAEVLSGGAVDPRDEVSEQDILDLELEHFMRLMRTEATRARIQYMLDHSKPLKN